MDMKCTVHDLIRRSRVQTQVGSNLGCMVLLSKSYLNQKYIAASAISDTSLVLVHHPILWKIS